MVLAYAYMSIPAALSSSLLVALPSGTNCAHRVATSDSPRANSSFGSSSTSRHGSPVATAGGWRSSGSAKFKIDSRAPGGGKFSGDSQGPQGHGYRLLASVADSVPTRNHSKVTEKVEFDNIQDLIVSQPSISTEKNVGTQPQTLLEREAEALEGSAGFSGKERTEVVTGLLDFLEQRGVPPGYAFEFARHAADLIEDLFADAQAQIDRDFWPADSNASSTTVDDDSQAETGFRVLSSEAGYSAADIKRERKIIELLQSSEVPDLENFHERARVLGTDFSLAARVADSAERRGLGNLVSYFHIIGMKAQNIPPLLPFLEKGMEVLRDKVEFLRSLGIKYTHLPSILVRWPELLCFPCEELGEKVDFLAGLGLDREDIGKMVIKLPQILGRAVEAGLQESVAALEDLGVQRKDVKRLVVRYPVLLTEESSEKLHPLTSYLEKLGVRRRHIGQVLLRKPLLLDCDVEIDLTPVGNYLKSLNASSDDIDKILSSFPDLFYYDVEQEFRPAVVYLESLGVQAHLLGKIFRRHPRLLKGRHNFEVKLDYLLSLGLERKDVGKVIYNAPQLLCLSVQENLEPTINYLASIGVKGSLLLKVLKRKPMTLAHSVQGKLKHNVNFLKNLGVRTEEIARLVSRHPQLLTLSVEKNLRPTVNYFVGVGYTSAEITAMLRKLPCILGLSVAASLTPKYQYLVDVMKRNGKELVLFPHYFSYSLSERIVTRHQLLGELAGNVSLNSLYSCNDAIFEERATRWLKESNQNGSSRM